jgi:uncharacterized protein (TIGR03084 family)
VADLAALLDDFAAEGDDADRMVAGLAPERWATPTPAPGWTIAHQIAHLTWTDRQARLSAIDPEAFSAMLAELSEAHDPLGFADRAADRLAAEPPAYLLREWRDGRFALTAAFAAVPAGTRLPWFGPPMNAASMVTARIMETWAHAQDIADALGIHRMPSARLKHVAHIGVRARPFAFHVHGLDAPADDIFVSLTAPDGTVWTWGDPGSAQSVRGPALDFCLLATQRRHRADLALTAVGPDADRWLDIAQAFAGPPGAGRQPGQFATGAAS